MGCFVAGVLVAVFERNKGVMMNVEQIARQMKRLAEFLEGEADLQPLNLGEIIAKLEKIFADGFGDAYITFDWGCAWPTGLDSYRGNYSQLCLEFSGEHRCHITVKGLLDKLKGKLGATVTGWKGGDYTVEEHQDVYVCCAGCTDDTRVIDIQHDRGKYSAAKIITANIDRD